MKRQVRFRMWVEAALAAVAGVLFLVTLVEPEWIEAIFRVEPDADSGALEWLIVGGLFAATVLLAGLARFEWRRAGRMVGEASG